MEETDEYIGRVPPSEKTNWKIEIQKALVFPKYVIHSPFRFMDAVNSAVEIVACNYPGWNAFKEVNDKIEEIKKEYQQKYKDWENENLPTRKWLRYKTEVAINFEMNKKIWEYLKNYVAIHGMLTEGPRDTRPMKYEEV